MRVAAFAPKATSHEPDAAGVAAGSHDNVRRTSVQEDTSS